MSGNCEPSTFKSGPRANFPPPGTHMPQYQDSSHQQMPHEPNTMSMANYEPSQPVGRSNANGPILGLSSQFSPSRTYNQRPPELLPDQQVIALEPQLRSMILSNEPALKKPATVSQTTGQSSAQQAESSSLGSSRRPNQAQRKNQMQVPLQHTPHSSTMMNARLPQVSNCPQYPPRISQHVRQSQSYNTVPQPRELFDPFAGGARGDTRHTGYSQFNAQQGVNNWTQLNYIDQLASAKIPEVEIGPEEYEEKQALRARLEKICRDAILDFDVQLDPNFQTASIELKCFGSLSIGFATRDSDMDLVLVYPGAQPDLSSPESEVPRMIEKILMSMGYGARLLTQTRVPIIKFCEKPGHELAAHLRLTRLQWETENEAHAKKEIMEPISSATMETTGVSDNIGSPISTDLQTSSPQSAVKSPSTSIALTLEITEDDHKPTSLTTGQPEKNRLPTNSSPELPISTPGGTKARNGSAASRTPAKAVNDPAWLWKMSDYELIGLYKIALKEDYYEPNQKLLITSCLKSLQASNESIDWDMMSRANALETLQNLSNVIQKCRKPAREDLDFPKAGVGTQCDINFSNQLALHNSLLLKCYSLCDPRVRQMVLFVKAWTKKRKINSPYHGTLNSYGYVLMVLHFLMNVARPPVIPNLQLASDMIRNDPLSSSEISYDGHNIQFFRNEAVIQRLARDGAITQNTESLGSLLRGFFQFFANPPYGAFSWKDDVLSLRTRGGILSKVGKGWLGARTEMVNLPGPGTAQKKVNHHYVVAIEDPFEVGHNVARTVFFNGVVAIRDEFRRAADLISNAGVDPRNGLQDFFAEGKKNENLQNRNHQARRDTGPKKGTAVGTGQATGKDTVAPKDKAIGKDTTAQGASASSKDTKPIDDIAGKSAKSTKTPPLQKTAESVKGMVLNENHGKETTAGKGTAGKVNGPKNDRAPKRQEGKQAATEKLTNTRKESATKQAVAAQAARNASPQRKVKPQLETKPAQPASASKSSASGTAQSPTKKGPPRKRAVSKDKSGPSTTMEN